MAVACITTLQDPLCAGRLVEVEELVMPAGGTHQAPKPMIPVNRPVGQNDMGMVAWVLTLRTPECPQGRKVHPCACCLVSGRSAPQRRSESMGRPLKYLFCMLRLLLVSAGCWLPGRSAALSLTELLWCLGRSAIQASE